MIRFTVLTAAEPVTKTLNARLEKTRDYPYIKHWTRTPAEIPADLETFHKALKVVAANPCCCIVTGEPVGDIPLSTPARRLKYARDGHSPTLAEPAPSNWFVADVDAVETGVELDPSDPGGQVAAVLGMMGFAGVSCVWQISSSARPFSTSARLRLWFVTDGALDNAQRKAIGNAINARAGVKLIDQALFQAVQPIYTAPPGIEGGNDPFPSRWGIAWGERETLEIAPLLARIDQPREVGMVTPRFVGGLDALLARIGDGPGQGGIHGPVTEFCYRAAAAGWTDEVIMGAVQGQVRTTVIDKRIHPDSYIKRETGTVALKRSIDGARERLRHADLPEMPAAAVEYLPLALAEKRLDEVMRGFFESDEPVTTVVKITTGAGKTHAMTRHLRHYCGNVPVFSATHNQAREIESALNDWTIPQAVRVRGRTQCDDIDTTPLCQRAGEIEAAHAAGIHQIAGLFCQTKWTDDQGVEYSERCPLFETCEYYRQFKGFESVRILPHEYLVRDTASAFTWNNSRWLGDVDRIVIDESPVNTLIGGHRSFQLSEIPADLPLLRGALDCIRAGRSDQIDKKALRGERADKCTDTTPDNITPATPGSMIASALKNYQRNPLSRFDGLYIAVLAYLKKGAVNWLWFHDDRVFYTYRRRSVLLEKYPALVLDASADETIYRALLGDDIQFIEINVRENLDVIQISNTPMGKGRLTADDLLPQVCALTHAMGGALISNKAAIEEAQAAGWLDSTPMGHFNALRGLNTLEAVDTLVVAGRTEPDALSVEAIARALWPDQPLDLPGQYCRMMTPAGAVNAHIDPRAHAVLRSIRDEEIQQAIGRLRACRSPVTKRCFVLSNVPVRAENVRYVGMDELLPDRRLSLALLRHGGTIPLNGGWLHENCPDLFESAKAGDRWRESFNPPSPYIIYLYRKTGGSSELAPREILTTVNFRLAGQKGGKPAKAVTWHDRGRTTQNLERLTRRAVTFCDMPEQAPPVPERVSVISTQWGEITTDPTLPAYPQVRALLCLFGLRPLDREQRLTPSERASLDRGKPADLANFVCRAIRYAKPKPPSELEILKQRVSAAARRHTIEQEQAKAARAAKAV